MDEVPLTAAEKETRFDEQWAFVMAGLDRAVAWIKEHKPYLRTGFSMLMNPKTGIEISIGYIAEDDEETLGTLRELFRGMPAEKRVDAEGHEQFLVRAAGLTFRWEIYHWNRRESTTTQVVL